MDQIRREYTLNFPIEKVKESIEAVSGDIRNKYPMTNKNDAFNSYSINIFFGLMHTIPVNIQLKKISDNETSVGISATLGAGTRYLPAPANEAIDKYVGLLGKTITGEHINALPTGGCMVVLLLICAILLSVFIS